MLDDVTLTGRHVELVPLEMKHIEELWAAGADPLIWTYLPVAVSSREQIAGIVTEALREKAAGTQFPFAVVDKVQGVVVGSTRYLNISLANRGLEIGWTWYSPSVWRSHVNTECKYLLLRHGFESLNLVRVQFKADSRNERSNRAIRRLGAIHEGVIRKERILHDGYIRDANLYSILEEEWPAVKRRFETELLRETPKK
ncbi:MAG: N-acetyltransferase [Paenibacillus sp.]|jgi:RimJ/RimL family protein N-acetyltransferase|nr:N-acetyltransferase [Paenibacillus sp.]